MHPRCIVENESELTRFWATLLSFSSVRNESTSNGYLLLAYTLHKGIKYVTGVERKHREFVDMNSQ